jgi:hypothetical protein
MAVIAPAPVQPRKALSGLKRFAPFLLLGPITGPLVAAIVFNYREGRPWLAGLYAVVLVAFSILLPYVTVALGMRVL